MASFLGPLCTLLQLTHGSLQLHCTCCSHHNVGIIMCNQNYFRFLKQTLPFYLDTDLKFFFKSVSG